jgi:hypothetical protein
MSTDVERLTTREHTSLGVTYTEVYIDGQHVGYHKSDPILDSFYGGEVFRPAPRGEIQIAPRWHRLGSGACFLSDVLKAAREYIQTHPI